ncbi:uncharacterized protein LOC129618768 [Condylostylus longicornis]|uniref:uncharacterized protein LOC129618768 n=1 Tax=Condylostylus longicornis TaxID=2530218 RepID=UPI00244E3875|nr:uncharacterized protein LOC129618768 [Condylostylus longicornis]
MSAKLSVVNKKVVLNNSVKVQYIPAAIHGCGKANMSTHFDPYTEELEDILSNSLRGYPMKGEKMNLDSRFIGICTRNSMRISDENESKALKAFGSFNSLIYWNYDAIPSKSDPFKQALQMPDILDNVLDITASDIKEEIKKHS